jgi:hypothetical protein
VAILDRTVLVHVRCAVLRYLRHLQLLHSDFTPAYGRVGVPSWGVRLIFRTRNSGRQRFARASSSLQSGARAQSPKGSAVRLGEYGHEYDRVATTGRLYGLMCTAFGR